MPTRRSFAGTVGSFMADRNVCPTRRSVLFIDLVPGELATLRAAVEALGAAGGEIADAAGVPDAGLAVAGWAMEGPEPRFFFHCLAELTGQDGEEESLEAGHGEVPVAIGDGVAG